MLRNWRFYVAMLFVALVAVGGTLVVGSKKTDVQSSAPAPACPAPYVAPSRTSAPTIEEQRQEAVNYMRSPARVRCYKEVWGAAETVARALDAGKLGPVTKYNANKTDLVPGYAGWGGMQSQDHQFYAWVWWKADGSVDYSRGITGFAVRGLQVESLDIDSGPFTSFIPRGGAYIDVVDTMNIGDEDGWYGDFRAPTTLPELMKLDREVLALIPANMQAAGLA